MQVNDGPSSHPIFVAPVNGNAQRSSGYVPGRIVPVRSPPPVKCPPPPPLKPPVPPPVRPSVFNLSEDESRREHAQNQQRKNTYICVGVFFCVFLLILIVVLSLASKDVLDGKTRSPWMCEKYTFVKKLRVSVFFLKCPYYGLWKVHILVLGVPNNMLTYMQGHFHCLIMCIYFYLICSTTLRRFAQRLIFPNPSIAWG